MIEIQAPNFVDFTEDPITIFLAGSIEMNTAERWQEKVIEQCQDLNVTFLNPRRDDWDNAIKQDKNDEKFKEQVDWELNSIEESAIVFFYFDPNTKSPITLLELGIVSGFCSDRIIVCCPEGYWKKGNVDIVSNRMGAILVGSLEEGISELKKLVKEVKVWW